MILEESLAGSHLVHIVWQRLQSLTNKMAMSPSSTVHGGQHDTKYVTFELLMHAAFVADEILGFMLEPARN